MTPVPQAQPALHILVVDDEPTLTGFISTLLVSRGYEVTALNEAASALQFFAANPHAIDAVIVDQTMPGMNGTDMALEMLRRRAELPILLITGFSETMNPARAQALNIRGFLQKPFRAQELLTALEEVTGR